MTNIARPNQDQYNQMIAEHTLEVLAGSYPKGEGCCGFFSCRRDSNNAIAIYHCGHPDNKDESEGNCFKKNCPTGAYNLARAIAIKDADAYSMLRSILGTLPEGEVEQAAVGKLNEVGLQEIVDNMAAADEPSLHALMDEGEHALIDGVMAVADSVAGHVLLQAHSVYSTLCAAQAYVENASAKHEIREARAKLLAPPPTIWPFSAGSWASVPTSDIGARTQDVCFAIGLLMAGLVIARRASFAHAAQGEQAEAAVAEEASLP